jgi:hypothetical protein
MAPKVPKIEIGTATLVINVTRKLRKKRYTMIVTSITASASVSSVSCNEERMVVLRSMAIAASAR